MQAASVGRTTIPANGPDAHSRRHSIPTVNKSDIDATDLLSPIRTSRDPASGKNIPLDHVVVLATDSRTSAAANVQQPSTISYSYR